MQLDHQLVLYLLRVKNVSRGNLLGWNGETYYLSGITTEEALCERCYQNAERIRMR